jgi:hypothetical protein
VQRVRRFLNQTRQRAHPSNNQIVQQVDDVPDPRCSRETMQQGPRCSRASRAATASHRCSATTSHCWPAATLLSELEKKGMRPGLRTTAPARCPVALRKNKDGKGSNLAPPGHHLVQELKKKGTRPSPNSRPISLVRHRRCAVPCQPLCAFRSRLEKRTGRRRERDAKGM